MWGIDALKSEYDVSLLTTGTVDLGFLNGAYGTKLLERDFEVVTAPMPGWLRALHGGDALKGSYFLRFCRSVAHEFDVLVSAYNLLDVGMPAIHFVADFSWDRQLREKYDPPPTGLRGLFHQKTLLRGAYTRLRESIAAPTGRAIFAGDDLIVANSQWSAAILKDKYGVEARVIYPPVAAEFPESPIGGREVGAVCIGRISPEKRIEQIVDIVRGVRNRGHDLHLHIIGHIEDDAYGRRVCELAEHAAEWVKLEGPCFGERKRSLLAGHLIGIHARPGEAFGIAVAEMVKAGCLTFVPEKSAPAEIVGHSALTYKSTGSAVAKICNVLDSQMLQAELYAHVIARAELFSTTRFTEEVRRLVGEFGTADRRRNEHTLD